jgi:hypothetical protein
LHCLSQYISISHAGETIPPNKARDWKSIMRLNSWYCRKIAYVGPQVKLNAKTWRTTNAINVSPPCLFLLVSNAVAVPGGANVKCPTRPATSAQIASSKAPIKRDFLRPHDSIRRNAGSVPTTETAPRIV